MSNPCYKPFMIKPAGLHDIEKTPVFRRPLWQRSALVRRLRKEPGNRVPSSIRAHLGLRQATIKKAVVTTTAQRFLCAQRIKKCPLRNGSPSGNVVEMDNNSASSDCRLEFSFPGGIGSTYYRRCDSNYYPNSSGGRSRTGSGKIAAGFQPNSAGPRPHQRHALVHLPSPRSKPP